MKLIIVERSQFLTYQRLLDKFSDDLSVRVIWDRRRKQIRQRPVPHAPERRSRERRRLVKPWNGKDYVVINVVMDQPTRGVRKSNWSRLAGPTDSLECVRYRETTDGL
jgi:hypothetical protein